jgi:hypothetical protein
VSGSLLALGLGLPVLLSLPPARHALEASMPGHMLVQFPLLVASGYLLTPLLPVRVREGIQAWNAFGIAGITLATATALFWMLPRNLDATLTDPWLELGKFLSLPLLLGLPLRLSWQPLTALGRGLVLSNLVAMLWVLAWVYLAAPARVCNNYLLDEQTLVGRSLLVIGCAVALSAGLRPFFPATRRRAQGGSA